MDLHVKLGVALALVLALHAAPAASQGETEAAAPPSAESGEPSGDEPSSDEQQDYWLLEEFDWGDDEEVVAESVLFDPYFSCNGVLANPCILVSTTLDGEQLLANFQHHEGALWQVVFLTPDLDPGRARNHLPRLQRVLVDYVTRMKGEPLLAGELPELDSLSFGPPQPTHFWSLPDMEVRVMVGRRDEDLFYLGVFFSDPVRGKAARPEYEKKVAEADARKRKRRAATARRMPQREAVRENP